MRRPTGSLAAAALAALAIAPAGCFPEVDVELPADHETWDRFDATGEIGGHGDTYRIIYVNDVARSWTGAGTYPVGSIVVKEIRRLTDDGGAGDLSYLAIMRRLDAAPDGGELDQGWLFTYADRPGAAEVQRGRCWDRCHASAPYDGLFIDYRLR